MMGSLEDLLNWQGGLSSSNEGAVEIRGQKNKKQESIKKESFSLPKNVKIRKETKKRGGHPVYVLYDIGGENINFYDFCKILKNALACGGSVDGETIVIQCSQLNQLYRVLDKNGIKHNQPE